MRLAKHLAHSGVASRRASEQLIFDGRVEVDNRVVTDPATDVTGQEHIRVDGKTLRAFERGADRVVYLLHKPAGVVSTAKDTHGRKTVVEYVRSPGTRLYPVGRLDADTTGLILLTDDGDLAHRLTHPSFEVPKVYLAEVEKGPVREPELRRLREGVKLEDGMTSPAKVRQLRQGILELTIHEGRKRQVKRMCAEVGHPVKKLQRVAYGPLRLGDLAEGGVRRLSAAEVERLRALEPGGPEATGREGTKA
ncbi:MAG: rRNA pseudouridine synthase [Solirubrobacterales bacterium]|jgi:23S rRNA pseudouridine2605 synthase|nr:rRNA pseudouridine synthase [Solirubrobacterales bacterium]